MSNPLQGYNLSAQVNQMKTQATAAAKNAAGQVGSQLKNVASGAVKNSATKAASGAIASWMGGASTGSAIAGGLGNAAKGALSGAAAGLGDAAKGALSGVAKNASDALQQGVSGAMADLAGKADGLMGNAASSLTQAAAKTINAKLADAIFTATSDEDVLTVDAYSIKDNDILNSTVGKLKGFAETSMMDFKSIGSSLLGSALGGLSGQLGGALGGLGGGLGGIGGSVAGALGGLTGGISGGIGGMAGKLAGNNILGMAVNMAVTDKVNRVINDKITDTVNQKVSGALSGVSGGLGGMLTGAAAQAAGGGFNGSNGGLSLNIDGLKDRVGAALSGVQSSARGITDNLVGNITNSLNIHPMIGQAIQVRIGDAVQDLVSDQIHEAKDLMNVVNQISGNKNLVQFFDVGAESALLSMVFNDAIRLKLPGAVETLFQSAKSNEAAHYALASNIEVATQIGDVDVLMTLTDSLGANLILSQVPNAAHRVLASYRFPRGTTVDDYPELWTKLDTMLTAMKPNWGYRERNGELLIDLAYFVQLSPDAATLLHWEGPFKDYISLRHFYRLEHIHDVLAGMYPGSVISLRE